MPRRQLIAPVGNGELSGWVDGSGQRVLLLHGGPGLSFTYLADVVGEIGVGFEVATYQQRGLPPSTATGPYDVKTQVDDVASVLDSLGWETATVVGHSWGGHLALHVAAVLADRLDGVLCVDALGAVGDGGGAAFEQEMLDRTPAGVRQKAQELDERALSGDSTEDAAVEGLRLVWPAYFADPATAPPMPPLRLSVDAYSKTFDSLREQLPALEAALPSITTPVGFVAGSRSPMPTSASTDAAARIPGAWVDVVDGAGHFPWIERPGSVRAALMRLLGG